MKKIDLLKHLLTKLSFKTGTAFILLFSISSITHAQDVLVASSNNASGSGGSVSYSVGQTIQNTNASSDGSAIQGIQFYFASSTLTVVDVDTNLNISTYPNPTSSTLNLKIKGNQNDKFSYKLFNLLGALITKGSITNNTAKINIEHLDIATYLLQVSNSSNNSIKTFKIIKN